MTDTGVSDWKRGPTMKLPDGKTHVCKVHGRIMPFHVHDNAGVSSPPFCSTCLVEKLGKIFPDCIVEAVE